jgi:hypothetical protein
VALGGRASFAAPLTLADLNAGQIFPSLDGSLIFSFAPGSVTTSGSVTSPLSEYEVIVSDKGFDVVGAWSAFGGEVGSMQLTYNVSGQTLALASASLAFTAGAVGEGSLSAVDETLGQVGSLAVHARDGDLMLLDSILLAGTDLSLSVTKDISVTSAAAGAATISLVSQEFEVVPEPGSAALMLLGAGGLLLLRRRA